ncbi:MAG: DUF6017 domain-containing protein [Clostridia bacterium]
MATCKIHKTKDYTIIANHCFKNEKLSLKAKGLLSLTLSLPITWNYTVKGLSAICADGTDSISSGIKELETHKYISRERKRNEKGQLVTTHYNIYEQPIDYSQTQNIPVNDFQCKVKVNKDFSIISNHHLRDIILSLKAKGLLSLMLSLPSTWDFTVQGLTNLCTDSINSVSSAVKELEKKQYIIRKRIRNEKGQLTNSEYYIFEKPTSEEEVDSVVSKATPKPKKQKETCGQVSQNQTATTFEPQETFEPEENDETANFLLNLSTDLGYTFMRFTSIDDVKDFVYNNIEIEAFTDDTDKKKAKELANLIIEILCSTQKIIKVGSNEFPSIMVKQKFAKISNDHIEYVLYCFSKNTTNIKNIREYLIVSLFNAPSTIDSYYENMVNNT